MTVKIALNTLLLIIQSHATHSFLKLQHPDWSHFDTKPFLLTPNPFVLKLFEQFCSHKYPHVVKYD